MDTSCCSLSVKVVFQNSSRLGNRPRCKVPFNQDIAFPSFTAISSDKASFLPNAQYQSLACAASLLTIQTQQENTFARASDYCEIVSTVKMVARALCRDKDELLRELGETEMEQELLYFQLFWNNFHRI